jgi:hypothetical protein
MTQRIFRLLRLAGYRAVDWGTFSLFGKPVTLQFGKKIFIEYVSVPAERRSNEK